jgi:hypothetical protein
MAKSKKTTVEITPVENVTIHEISNNEVSENETLKHNSLQRLSDFMDDMNEMIFERVLEKYNTDKKSVKAMLNFLKIDLTLIPEIPEDEQNIINLANENKSIVAIAYELDEDYYFVKRILKKYNLLKIEKKELSEKQIEANEKRKATIEAKKQARIEKIKKELENNSLN